ncbi:MAG: hypothetical protein JSS27_08450 [Planctomycetes bacterium]|nr:hypothetical protein [Planctomycetota bacterium]
MFRTLLAAAVCAVALVVGLAQGALAEIPPGDQLFPATTKAFVSVANWPDAIEKFNRTPLGLLLQDEKMEAFTADLRKQLDGDKGTVAERLGMPLEDLEALPSGEVSAGLVELPSKVVGGVVLFDVAQNVPQAQAALKKVETRMLKDGAKRATQESKAGQVTLTVFTIPPRGERKETITAIYFLHEGLLGFADNLAVVEDILVRWKNRTKDGLNTNEDYVATSKQANRNDLKPDVRWYVDPLATLSALQGNMNRKMGGRDLSKVLSREFAALKAAAGVVVLDAAPYGLIHSNYVLAPQPFERGMKVLTFPNAKAFPVPKWVPSKIASYTAFSWDVLNAFDHFDTLFDEFAGDGEEGVWKDVLDSIKTDPNGPQIDLRDDLVAHTGQHCIFLIDTELPVGPYSQRRLFAVEAKNEAKLAAAVERAMQGDKEVRIHEVIVAGKTHRIFEMMPEEDGVPAVQVQVDGQNQVAAAAQPPHQAVTVAHGWMFIATHVDSLVAIIKSPKAAKPLADDQAYAKVLNECGVFHKTPRCIQMFNRDDERLYLAYELFRIGKLPEADLPIAEALNAIFSSEVAEGEVRKPKLNGEKLPDFAVVRKYFDTSGVFGSTENNGWFVMGFLFNKVQPPARTENAGKAINAEARRPDKKAE